MAQQVKNPPDRWVWWATVQRVTESQTRLSNKVRACVYVHTHTHTHTCLDQREDLLFTEKPEAVPKPLFPHLSPNLCPHRDCSENVKHPLTSADTGGLYQRRGALRFWNSAFLERQIAQIPILSSEDREISLSFSFWTVNTLLGKERKFSTLKCKQLPPGKLEKYV